jgi:branched-chain amino acid transport system permease protein
VAGFKLIGRIVIGVALLLGPFVLSSYELRVLINVGITTISLIGFNILLGFSGQFILMQAGFFGLGAYCSALLAMKLGWNVWLAMPAAVLFVSLLGLIVGFVLCRWKGHYVALVSIGLNVIIFELILNLRGITMGGQGLREIPQPDSINLFNLYTLDFGDPRAWYFVVLAGVIISLILCERIRKSEMGMALFAVRDDEVAAGSMGINVFKLKVIGFALSAPFGAAAGAIYAHYMGSIVPYMAEVTETFSMLVMMIIGGLGSVPGMIIGAVMVKALPEYLRFIEEYRQIIFGLLLIGILFFAPEGIAGLLKVAWASVKKAHTRK